MAATIGLSSVTNKRRGALYIFQCYDEWIYLSGCNGNIGDFDPVPFDHQVWIDPGASELIPENKPVIIGNTRNIAKNARKLNHPLGKRAPGGLEYRFISFSTAVSNDLFPLLPHLHAGRLDRLIQLTVFNCGNQ